MSSKNPDTFVPGVRGPIPDKYIAVPDKSSFVICASSDLEELKKSAAEFASRQPCAVFIYERKSVIEVTITHVEKPL